MIKTVFDVCATEWLDITEAPDYLSFRCLIKFKEHGVSGPSYPYISTGCWFHRSKEFDVDAKSYAHYTPVAFIPLYDQIT